jgi:hypothetical protein
MGKLVSVLCAFGGLWLARGAHAQDAQPPPPPPDLDFLEYLGAWQAADDEWLVSEEWQKNRGGEEDKKRDEKVDGKRPRQARNDDDDDDDESD